MELKFSIGYNELIELIKQLPSEELARLKKDLAKTFSKKAPKDEKKEGKKQEPNQLTALLLNGPTMTEEQYEEFKANREWINQWKTRIVE